jgi:hypothetical protein
MAQRLPQEEDLDNLTVPPRYASEASILGYCKSTIERGNQFLMGQPAYPDIAKGREIVHGMNVYNEQIPDKLSHTQVNRIKKNIREEVALLANLRPTWDYTSNNPQMYENQANVVNKLHNAWFFSEKVDRSIRQALQYAATEGTGYLYMTWEQPIREKTGRIKLTPLGAMSYIPFQQGFDNKIQNAEVGIVCTEIPLAKARRTYKRPDLTATNTTATNLERGGVRGMITNLVSPFLAAGGPNRKRDNSLMNTPTVNIYHLYIKDDSLNESGDEIKMGPHLANGEPETNYAYTVPTMGQPIATGKYVSTGRVDPITEGAVLMEETREAAAADCLLYPNLRLIICTLDTLIYDGPSMWWHGKIPIVQFRFDDWPWNFLGFSLVRDTWRLEESITGRMRAVDDSTNAKLNPALQIDSRMSDQFDNKFNPRIPGGRMVTPPNLMNDKPISPVLTEGFYNVDTNTYQGIKDDEQRLDSLMGLNGFDDIMRLKQIPQSDSLDKLIGASSAVVTDIARNMESSIHDLGALWLPMAFQYYTTGQRMRLLGDDGVTLEDFDFKPGYMIPSHMPGEDPSRPSRFGDIERARLHIDSFQFNVVPNSLTELTSITRKMLMLQCWRDPTFPKDPWSLAEDLDIPNMGPVPPDCHNRIDRFKAWIKLLAEVQREAQGGADGGGLDPMALVQQMLGGKGAVGRPPSGNAPPAFKRRTDGSQTITESR